MKTSIGLKTSQQLALTPQLQQSIKLLQMSTIELREQLESTILENPLLEFDENAGSPQAENGENLKSVERSQQSENNNKGETEEKRDDFEDQKRLKLLLR